MKLDKVIGEFSLYGGRWFHVPGGFWERRRPATEAEVARLTLPASQ